MRPTTLPYCYIDEVLLLYRTRRLLGKGRGHKGQLCTGRGEGLVRLGVPPGGAFQKQTPESVAWFNRALDPRATSEFIEPFEVMSDGT